MSENKDLEIIKKELHSVTGIGSSERIEKAAERMAAEIERLEAKIKKDDEEFGEVLPNLADKIDRLKAELEKRPEVVYCKDCIYKNQCKAAVIFQESTSKIEGPFKFYYLKFCSYGQRKSEEGK